MRWIKAHMTRERASTALLSDGTKVTPLVWRANRLADALAGATAARQAPTADHIRLLKDAAAALRHEAAVLGIVTRAATCHRVSVPVDGGGTRVVVRRDAAGPRHPPRRKGARQERRADAAALAVARLDAAADLAPSGPCRTASRSRSRRRSPPHPARERMHAARRLARAAERAREDNVIRELLARTAGNATSAVSDGTARFAALRARVAARAAGAAPP